MSLNNRINLSDKKAFDKKDDSGQKHKKKRNKKFKNEKLYRRINLSFSVMNMCVTALVIIIMLIICVMAMRNFQKNNLIDFSRTLYDEIDSRRMQILALDERDRAEYIFNDCVLPHGDSRLEIGIAVGDDFNKIADTRSFDEFYTSARKVFDVEYTDFSKNEVYVQRFDHGGKPYIMINSRIVISGYRVIVVTYQNTSDTTTYTLYLLIIVSVMMLISIIATFLLGIWVSRKALTPLEGIAESVKSITEENLSLRLSPSHDNMEVDSLIIALNNMLQRLSVSFDMQKMFVNDVSHEMRIPLTIIQGNLDIITSWGMDDENVLRDCIDAIQEEVKNIKNMTERLLYLHNVTSGNLKFNPMPLRAVRLMNKIFRDTELLTHNHIILKDYDVPEDTMIFVDRLAFEASLRALIDNSIKYTPEGGVITLGVVQEKNDVKFIVSDTGCGIEEEYVDKIFTRFYRTDSARRKTTGGSGLGLAIVKANVEAMGGDIYISSRVSDGTKAVITIPVYTDAKKEDKHARK